MISVIIPYRNAAAYIARCERSLVSQDGDFEFIFVDDNSTDGAEPQKDDRVFLFRNEHAAGVSGARNTGLDHAHGEWITFLDVDDEYLPNAWDKFQKMLKVDALIYQSNHVRHYVQQGWNRRKWDNPQDEYILPQMPKVWVGVWNKLYSKSLVDGIRFKEGMQYGEDELFNLECIKIARRIYNIGDVIVRHNIDNKESLSHIRTAADLIRESKEIEDFILECDDPVIKKFAYDTLLNEMTRAWYRGVICNR